MLEGAAVPEAPSRHGRRRGACWVSAVIVFGSLSSSGLTLARHDAVLAHGCLSPSSSSCSTSCPSTRCPAAMACCKAHGQAAAPESRRQHQGPATSSSAWPSGGMRRCSSLTLAAQKTCQHALSPLGSTCGSIHHVRLMRTLFGCSDYVLPQSYDDASRLRFSGSSLPSSSGMTLAWPGKSSLLSPQGSTLPSASGFVLGFG